MPQDNTLQQVSLIYSQFNTPTSKTTHAEDSPFSGPIEAVNPFPGPIAAK